MIGWLFRIIVGTFVIRAPSENIVVQEIHCEPFYLKQKCEHCGQYNETKIGKP